MRYAITYIVAFIAAFTLTLAGIALARTALGYTQDRVAALENLVKQRDIQIADLRSDFAAIVARIESIEADHVNMMDNSNGSNSY